jgi:amidase
MAANINSLPEIDATGDAEQVSRGELPPLGLAAAAIGRIERLNSKLSAVMTPLFDEGRQRATSKNLPEGPFRGVPSFLKDLGRDAEGPALLDG